ncbi:MAG: hypothetical protein KAS32_28215 [Candidatus Peribacteraceae bacterium]|nr:hypothetical protein [Candidatus Peribacteraceae bacterium]
MKDLKLLTIDDMRTISGTHQVRTYEDGIEALRKEEWDILYLDHDLGCFDDNGREYTGYDILCWLESNQQYLPKRIELLTSNPVGRKRMNVVILKLYGRLWYG